MPDWKDFLDPDARGGRFLPWKDVARATGLSRTTAWRLQKRNEFPAPYVISPGRVGYREDEVEAWQASRGHSAARPRGAVGRQPGASGDATLPVAQRQESCGTGKAAATGAKPDASAPSVPASAEPIARAEPRTPAPASPPPRARSGRRRSQHAQAIAQQILFDF